jgi:hypothetical protein
MPRKEFDLLAKLASVPGQLCSREELLEGVFGYDDPTDDRTLDVHMYRLRSKLEKDPAHPTRIVTVRGVGFLLNDSELRARGGVTPAVTDGATGAVVRRGPLRPNGEAAPLVRKRRSSTPRLVAPVTTQSTGHREPLLRVPSLE